MVWMTIFTTSQLRAGYGHQWRGFRFIGREVITPAAIASTNPVWSCSIGF